MFFCFFVFLIWSDHHLHGVRTVPLDTVLCIIMEERDANCQQLHLSITGRVCRPIPQLYKHFIALFPSFFWYSFCPLMSLALTNCSRVKTPVCTLSVRMSFCHEISWQLALCFESHCWILGIGHGWLKGKFPTKPATSAAFLDGLIIQMRPHASTPVL